MMMADQTRLLRELEAERAIRALMGAYLAARDGRRPGREIAELFAPDGVWEGAGRQGAQLGRHHGRAAIARRFSGPLPPTLHLLTEEDIRVTGDRARGRWRYLAPAVLDGEPTWMAGRYEIDFVVHADRWRFAHVRVRPLLAAAHRQGWVTLGEPDGHDTQAGG
jgi:SnoaL-like domain